MSGAAAPSSPPAASPPPATPPASPPPSVSRRLKLPFLRVLPRGGTAGEGRKRAPTILQMEAVECGAASLAMILAHHGRVVPLEELRLACGISRDGSKASNIVKAARSYGLVAKGYKKEPQQLKELPAPMIVHWNFNHFVVLEGFGKGLAYLNDPGTGPRTVTEAEFDEAFTGVALVFEKGDGFVRGGAAPSLAAALSSRLRGSRLALLFVVLAGLALVVPGLVVPVFSRVFVDDVLVGELSAWVKPLLALMGATALAAAGLTWLQQRYLLRLETKLALDTSSRFFWHVLHLPIQFFTQRFAGEIGSRVAINDRVAQVLSGDLATNVLGLVALAFYGVVMLQYSVGLTFLGLATAALNMGALRWVSRKRVDLNLRLGQDRGKLTGVAMGGLQTIETLKATGSESDFFARWSGYQAKVVNAQQQLAMQTQLLASVPPLLLALNSALVLGIGGLQVMDGKMSMGMLIAFQALMLSFVTPVNRLVEMGSTLQEVRGDMSRLDDVLRADRQEGLDDDPEEAEAWGKLTGRLELTGVAFGYNPVEPPLVQDLSISLAPGSRVALVGGSGCGKSTIARLVCGLSEPWAGEVTLDGVPRVKVPRRVLSSSLAFVDQDIFLFEGTVRDNLTLWDPTVPEADLIAAARDAAIHDEVTSRPGGYLGTVEEGGRNFSGGQRQRLEIARALVGNPSILVLDEATSALDPSTEQAIDDNLRRRGCTCLIVAHRLSTIRDCDEIIVLDAGKIVQRGTHQKMMAEPGPYARLMEAE